MSSTYGENLKLSIFGQSHGAAIGMTLDGIPAGLPVDTDALQIFLNRRAPGQNDWSTPRKEADRPEFLSGILDGFTCGAPIAAIISSKDSINFLILSFFLINIHIMLTFVRQFFPPPVKIPQRYQNHGIQGHRSPNMPAAHIRTGDEISIYRYGI